VRRRVLMALAGLPFAALPLKAMQLPHPGFPDPRERPKRLPDGRLQSEAILREDYERNLREIDEMDELLQGVEEALAKAAPGKTPREVLRDLQQVERISKRIHSRMRRF
jgi:hypothetical protein